MKSNYQDSLQSAKFEYQQSGFTLMELMIALVLGLLISAAAVQVYIVNFQTTTVQQSSSDIQDASIFGIQRLEEHIRLANLGNNVTHINDETLDGGIVLTGLNMRQYQLKSDGSIDLDSGKMVDAYENTGYLTRSSNDTEKEGDNGWTGVSHTDIKSDQLTIQFKNVTGKPLPDCEGDDIAVDAVAVERYYLREVADINDIVLACDAGRVELKAGTDNEYEIKDFGEVGQTVISGVDQFTVLVGSEYTNPSTSSAVGQMMYLPSNTYMTIEDKDTNDTSIILPKPPITSVKVGLIIHGSTTILGSSSQTTFDVLGQPNVLTAVEQNNKRMRTTFEFTSLLRNARVINVTKGSSGS